MDKNVITNEPRLPKVSEELLLNGTIDVEELPNQYELIKEAWEKYRDAFGHIFQGVSTALNDYFSNTKRFLRESYDAAGNPYGDSDLGMWRWILEMIQPDSADSNQEG